MAGHGLRAAVLALVAGVPGLVWALAAPAPDTNEPSSGDAAAPSTNDAGGPPSAQGPSSHGSIFAANQLVGQITKIDPASRNVTIQEAKASRTLKLGDDTTVFVEGRLGTAQDLKEGQQVRAAFETHSGQLTLRWIEVAPAASDSGTATESPSQPGSSTPPVSGTVVRNDPASGHLVVQQGTTRLTLKMNENTRVTTNGKSSPRDALKEGQQIRVSFDPSGQVVTVVEITGTSPPAKPASPTTPPQPPDTTY